MSKSVLLLILLLQVTPVAFCQQKDNGFLSFWTNFRTAVLQSDAKALDSLTLFPLVIKGTLDSDPVKKTGPKNFPVVLKKCLAQPNINYSGTVADVIKATTTFSAREYTDMRNNMMRVEDFEFKKIKGKWLLYLIYIDSE